MCLAANVYIKPAFCPFHFLYTQLWAYSADGEVVQHDNPFDGSFHNTFECKTLDHKTMRILQGHFMWFFLNDILQCFLQVINIWQPRDKMSHQLRVSKSLPFCLCLWILFLKAKWPMNIFCNMTWVGYEMALLGAGRPTLPGPNNRGQYTAPPNRWFVQW